MPRKRFRVPNDVRGRGGGGVEGGGLRLRLVESSLSVLDHFSERLFVILTINLWRNSMMLPF